jgi:hypothetical protein
MNDTATGSTSSIHSKQEIPVRVAFPDSDMPSLGWSAHLRYLAAAIDPLHRTPRSSAVVDSGGDLAWGKLHRFAGARALLYRRALART